MAMPDYQSLMLPAMKLASDGKEHKFSSAVEVLSDEFMGNCGLSPIVSPVLGYPRYIRMLTLEA